MEFSTANNMGQGSKQATVSGSEWTANKR